MVINMQKVYVILPDPVLYSLYAKSFVRGFRFCGYFVKYCISSELDKNEIFEFKPDIFMCFDLNELKDNFLNELYEKNSNCTFIFNFLTKIDEKNKLLDILYQFKGKKLIFSADSDNYKKIKEAKYLPNRIYFKNYNSKFSSYTSGITIVSDLNNTNVLKVITDLIAYFGRISIYADEIDYVNSLNNSLWDSDNRVKELYRQSYCGEIRKDQERAKIFNSSVINIVPIAKFPNSIDFTVLEICASSAFAIVEENSEIKRCFEIGHELETYKNSEELIDKIEFYLKNPSIANSIANNARKAAVNNHSIIDSIKNIEKYISD